MSRPTRTAPIRLAVGCVLAVTAVLSTSASIRAPIEPPGQRPPAPGRESVAGGDRPGPELVRALQDLAGVRAERQSRLLDGEDARLLDLVSTVPFGARPYTVPADGNTLVLTPAGREYGLADLQSLGAVVRLDDGVLELVQNVLVAPGAALRINAPGTVLRMRSDQQGFVSLVAWKARLVLVGAKGAPLTVTSWSAVSEAPDPSPLDGRAYIRASGGRMDLAYVDVSDLGFWAGRTGGVAWTGSPRAAGSGSVSHSTFVRGHYGLFASAARDLTVTDSAFVANSVDGVALHRRSAGIVLTGVRAARNGRHGISADVGSEALHMTGVEVTGNAYSGISFSGAPFAVGASAGGAPTRTYGGVTITGGLARDNGREGVRVVQSHDVSISGLTVAGSRDGVVLVGTRSPTKVRNVVVRDVRRFGISVQDGAVQVVGNRLAGGRTGIRLADASGTVRGNEIRATRHYGVSVSGNSGRAVVAANTITGRGPAAVDTFRLDGGADVDVRANDARGWTEDEDDWQYWSRFVPRHPMVLLWVVVLLLPTASYLRARRRRPAPGTPPYAADELRRVPHQVRRLDGTPV